MKVRARQTGATPAEGTEDNIDIERIGQVQKQAAARETAFGRVRHKTQAEAAGEAETQPGTQP